MKLLKTNNHLGGNAWTYRVESKIVASAPAKSEMRIVERRRNLIRFQKLDWKGQAPRNYYGSVTHEEPHEIQYEPISKAAFEMFWADEAVQMTGTNGSSGAER
jgi:hypothetical protein